MPYFFLGMIYVSIGLVAENWILASKIMLGVVGAYWLFVVNGNGVVQAILRR